MFAEVSYPCSSHAKTSAIILAQLGVCEFRLDLAQQSKKGLLCWSGVQLQQPSTHMHP